MNAAQIIDSAVELRLRPGTDAMPVIARVDVFWPRPREHFFRRTYRSSKYGRSSPAFVLVVRDSMVDAAVPAAADAKAVAVLQELLAAAAADDRIAVVGFQARARWRTGTHPEPWVEARLLEDYS